MPLAKGRNSRSKNINELMKGVQSEGRHKAILTISEKYGITYDEAMLRQAKRIAEHQASKR